MHTTSQKLLIPTWFSIVVFAAGLAAQTTPPKTGTEVVASPLGNRATGGTAIASSELNSPRWKEVAALAFDGSSDTKWFNVSNGASRADPKFRTGWLVYHFGNNERWTVKEYRITSANDTPNRDPRDWEFQGSDDGTTWVTLDTRSDQKFHDRKTTNIYPITNAEAYAYYRLNITRSGKEGDGIQLSELELLAAPRPSTPAAFAAKAGDTAVVLSWKASSDAAGYKVSRSATAGGPYAEIAKDVTGLTYSDAAVKSGTAYFYVVEAVGVGGTSATSAEVTAIIPVHPPTGLVAQAGRDQVALHWDAVDGDATYSLKRATSKTGPFALVAANILKPVCTDTALSGGLTYYYVVSATRDGVSSADSAAVSATLPPSTPANLAVIMEKRNAIVNWTASPGAVVYTLKRASSSDGLYAVVATELAATTYTDAGLNSGRTYYYVVSAANAGGESLVSAPVGIKVPNWLQRNFTGGN
jgi:fibronectin type 3 domain-containing protein